MTLLERVFLLERLPPWHSNRLSRLVKTPKLHFGDTGLACALLGPTATALTADRTLLGPLLETFVFQELRRQAAGHDVPHTFFHYRDKDRVEVDVIIERGPLALAGVEVRAGATVTAADFRGLRKLRNTVGKRFAGGVVLYDGEICASFGDGLYAVPMRTLWGAAPGEEPRMPSEAESVAASNTRPATLQPKPRTSNGVRGRGGRRGETTGRRRPSSPSDMSPARAMRKAGRAGKYLPHREVTVLPAQPPQLLALGACQTVLATPFIAVRLTDSVAHLLRRALELASQLPGRATRPHQGDAHTIWRRYSLRRAGGTSFCHRDTSSAQWSGVHQNGATPLRTITWSEPMSSGMT